MNFKNLDAVVIANRILPGSGIGNTRPDMLKRFGIIPEIERFCYNSEVEFQERFKDVTAPTVIVDLFPVMELSKASGGKACVVDKNLELVWLPLNAIALDPKTEIALELKKRYGEKPPKKSKALEPIVLEEDSDLQKKEKQTKKEIKGKKK